MVGIDIINWPKTLTCVSDWDFGRSLCRFIRHAVVALWFRDYNTTKKKIINNVKNAKYNHSETN